MVKSEFRMFVRTAPQAELKKRKGLKTFTAEDGEQVPHEALKDAKVVVHAESYYPYQKDISLRLADAKDPEGPLTGSVMLKAEPDGVCEYADDFEVDALAEANDSLTEIGLPTIPTKYTLVKISGKKREVKVDPKIAKKLKVEYWNATVNVIKTAHGRGRGGELVEEWTICALKGDKKSVAAAMPEFKEACLSIMGKSPGKPYLPAYVTCGFAEFITKIAGCVKPPSIEIKNRAAPGDPPLHIQKKKRKAGDAPAGDADDLPLNKLQKQVLPYSGKKRGPKSKAEKALAAMAAGAADDVPLLFMLPKKPMPVLPKRLPKKDKPPPKPKKLPYPGKKRGPKTKAEKAAMAAAAAAEAEADDEISLIDLAKKKIPYTGKKRGPKTKEEKAAIAAAAAAAGEDVTIAALAAKKPYTGKKRGPKTKAEKAAMAAAAEKNDEVPLSSMIKSPKKRGPKPKGATADATIPPPKKKVAQSGPKKSGKKVMGSLGDE